MRSAFPFILALLLLSLAFAMVLAETISLPSYNASEANMTIKNATLYISSINESGYFIFYPNLTESYAYLAKARLLYKDSPSSAVFYANKAEASAYSAYKSIGYYRTVSAAVSAVSAVVFAALLYILMKPAKSRRKGSKHGVIHGK